jgi:hypothetical protein
MSKYLLRNIKEGRAYIWKMYLLWGRNLVGKEYSCLIEDVDIIWYLQKSIKHQTMQSPDNTTIVHFRRKHLYKTK